MQNPVRPPDFHLEYEWSEGSLPPPEHYEYTIQVGPGTAGEIVFVPDYAMHDPPVWTKSFVVDEQSLDALYAQILERGLFEKSWPRRQDPPVGGSLEWLEVAAAGKSTRVPALAEGAETLQEIYRAIRSLVPEEIWSRLRQQQEQYQKEFAE